MSAQCTSSIEFPFAKDCELFRVFISLEDHPPSTVPGYSQISMLDYHQVNALLGEELSTPTLNLMAPHLWIMTTQSSANITPLHAHLIKGRHIVVTEDPGLHLVWRYDRVFLKPLPKFLLSYDFWHIYLYSSCCHPDLRKAALGLLRTYAYMIRHESDLTLAQTNVPPLLPSDMTWDQWTAFSHTFRSSITDAHVSSRYAGYGELRLTRLNFYIKLMLGRAHYAQTFHGQYATYFARFYAPLLFVFGLASVVLSAMQVELAVEGLTSEGQGQQDDRVLAVWNGMWKLSRWLSLLALGGAGLLAVSLCALFLGKFIKEWVFALRMRFGQRRSVGLRERRETRLSA